MRFYKDSFVRQKCFDNFSCMMIGTELVEVDRSSTAASRESADYFSHLPDLRDSDGLIESLLLSDPKMVSFSGDSFPISDDSLAPMQQVASKTFTSKEQFVDQEQTRAADEEQEDSESESGESDQDIDESDEGQ